MCRVNNRRLAKFIKLNTNENPYPPSPKVVEAIAQAAQTRLERYPDPLGNFVPNSGGRGAGLLLPITFCVAMEATTF